MIAERRSTAALPGRLLTAFGAAMVLFAAPAGGDQDRTEPAPGELLSLSSDLRVRVLRGRDVELDLRAADDDNYATIALRATGRESMAGAIASWNQARPVTPGIWVHVPLAYLSDSLRSLVLRSLFPRDHHDVQDWLHVARSAALPVYDEGLWQVADWFCGGGGAFEELMVLNGLASPELREGQVIRLPAKLLHSAFAARPRSDDGALEYATDPTGPYALYRLGAREAIYSAVVVRFTGRTASEDVHAVAAQLTARNSIRDVRDIPVGYEIKIPLELLETEFLPAGHPRRLEAESRRAEMERSLSRDPVAETRGGLRGVLLILDAGHGGRDLGTMNNGIWEHDYVYDVACRLKRILETESAARVALTLLDEETGCTPSSRDELVANRQGTILTTPRFLAREEGEATLGVNLRWYLANSIYRQALAAGNDPDRVLFLSIHADSRHPALRGLMVYVPGAGYRTETYGHSSSFYKQYKEVREKPLVRFSKNERVRSEAVSRKLAGAIVETYRRAGLRIQPYQPTRDKVIRGKSKWVPAVLRGNEVPGKVLVELVNLSNREDAAVLASARERDRLARGLADSLLLYFGERSGSATARAAAP